MIVFFNRRAYGRVEVYGGTFVVTSFWCLNLLPLVPHESHLVLARGQTGETTSVPVPAHAGSIAAGYLRVWGAFFAAGALVALLLSGTDAERTRAIAVFVVAAATCATAWLSGRLSAEERARRNVYREVTGAPVDPAWLPEETRRELAARLRTELGTRAPALAQASYREAPNAAWEDVAAEAGVTDGEFLQRAMVLARIEWREADVERRALLQRAWEEAWRKYRVRAG